MKIAAFCLCWISILSAPGVMAQQSAVPNQSWDALRQLQPGEKLRVERKTGKKKVSGEFISLSDTELVIERKGKDVRFGRDEVKNIWRPASPSREKRVKFGVIGGGVGLLVGLPLVIREGLEPCAGSCADEVVGAVAILAGFFVIGGLIGGAMARGEPVLIYSAP
jgi:hypothetical protein